MDKKIGILTGGGDCPGLNSAIKSAAQKAMEHGFSVLGIRDGWKGMLDISANFYLDAGNLQNIDSTGGTILGSSRTNPYKDPLGPKTLEQNFMALGLDALIAIGGEDTLGVAHRLYSDFALPIVGIPKTIDKDLSGTDYTLGFMSALEVITQSIDQLKSTAMSHGRDFVVEVMGRHAGHLALYGGISSGASLTLIPEHDFCLEKVCDLLQKRRNNGARYSITVISEGAKAINSELSLSSSKKDAFGHVSLGGIGEALALKIEQSTGISTKSIALGHLQRGGAPAAMDRILGYYFGEAAVEAILDKNFGIMTALINNKINLIALSQAVGILNTVDIASLYDTKNYRAKGTL